MYINRKELIKKQYNDILTSYWFYADPILMATHAEGGELWLVNNFINIHYGPELLPAEIFFFNGDYRNKMVEFYDCPYLIMQKFLFDCNKKINGRDIVEVIIENINNERFVLLMVDRYYLDIGYTRTNEHQLLIHGYNLEEEFFYYADNSFHGKFKTHLQCSFSNLREAFGAASIYKNEPDFSNSIFTFNINYNASYNINIPKIICQLRQYIDETRVFFNNSYLNGIGVYRHLIECFENNSLDNYDIRGLCVIRDHKSAMVYRIQYFEKYLKHHFESLDLFLVLKRKCDLMVLLYVKYGIKKDTSIMVKIIKMLSDIEQEEKRAIEKLILELESI